MIDGLLDIITVAKGIGNGFPMAGVLISPMFKPVYGQLGTTFGGNHLACSAALAVMDVIEQENLVENAAKVGNYLLEELKKFPQIKEVRGRGLMIGLEFDEPIKELRSRLIYDEHGKPLPIPLATVMMSGLISAYWWAKNLPLRRTHDRTRIR